MSAPATGHRKPKSEKGKSKPRIPKLHRLRKESTKTITTRLYKAWSAIVHVQHDDKCAVCGRENSKEAPLNAHHIMPRQMFSGLRFDPQNGISLCPKCHKLGKFSAHKGGIWFAEWLHEKYPEKYRHCMNHLNDELDCKDRSKLYAVESDLHSRYGDATEPLPTYDVVAYDRKGNKVRSVVQAYNNRAAEFIFWDSWPKTEIPLKGIHRTAEVKTKDLLDRISDHFGEIKPECSKPVSEMSEPEFVDYLNETFKGRMMDEGTMHQMAGLFVKYCTSHGIDPSLYVLNSDCHGNVSIASALSWDETPTSVIRRTTETKDVSPEKTAELKNDLIRRGLMDEDGNTMNVRQLPKSTDAAAIAIVQECGK